VEVQPLSLNMQQHAVATAAATAAAAAAAAGLAAVGVRCMRDLRSWQGFEEEVH
jgi:hypothetical protein